MVANYGWTRRGEESFGDVGDAWEGGVLATISSETMGYSTGFWNSIAEIGRELPADQWLGRFSRAPGIRKDAREWYRIDEWLAELGDKPVSPIEILDRLEAREFKMVAGWVEEGTQLALAILSNPASCRDFVSVHHSETVNVLLHVAIEADGATLRVREVQSDWNQAGAQTGWHVDPLAWKEAFDAKLSEANRLTEAWVAKIMNDAALMRALNAVAVKLEKDRDGSAADRGMTEHEVWFMLRRIAYGEISIPKAMTRSLPPDSTARLVSALDAFCERHRMYLPRHSGALASDPPVPEAPFKRDWPRLGLSLALAIAATSRAADGSPVFSALELVDGNAAAEASLADEPVRALEWVLEGDQVRMKVETSDENGNGATRPEIRVARDDLCKLEHMSKLCDVIDNAILAGRKKGSLSREWIEKRFDDYDDGIIWRNLALRRFYDSHLPRELKEIGKPFGLKVEGARIEIDEAARGRLDVVFGDLSQLSAAFDRGHGPRRTALA